MMRAKSLFASRQGVYSSPRDTNDAVEQNAKMTQLIVCAIVLIQRLLPMSVSVVLTGVAEIEMPQQLYDLYSVASVPLPEGELYDSEPALAVLGYV